MADNAEEAEIGDTADGSHDVDHFLAFAFESFQIVSIDLDRELTLYAADRLFHVVGDGLREVPECAGNLLEFAIHGGNQLFFILAENRTPFIFRLEVDEILGVEEAGGVGAVIRAADLGDDLGYLGKRRQRIAAHDP